MGKSLNGKANLVSAFIFALVGLFSMAKAQNWQPLPMQFDYTPYALFTDSSDDVLYILGLFEEVDGVPTNGIVAFDGSTWDSVGTQFQLYPIITMLNHDDKLYVGGGGLAIWDGQEWDTVSSDGSIWALYPYQGQLLVGGLFSTIGGDSLATLAAFDGISWHDALGTQTHFKREYNSISAIQEFMGELYIAGSIDYLGSMKEIMKWDGANWSDVGGGIGGGGMTHINDMEVYQGELYIGGYFSEADGSPGNNIARWDGTRWKNVGEGVGQGQVFELYTFEGKLYASGQFYTAAGVPASFIAYWDGASWCSFGGVIDNAISGMAAYHDELYVAGGFWTMDGDSIRGIAKWVGGNYVDTCVYVPVGLLETAAPKESAFAYPNPANDRFTVSLPPQTGSCMLYVIDATGRVVMLPRQYIIGELDISMFPTGLYFIHLIIKDKVEVVKLVKE